MKCAPLNLVAVAAFLKSTRLENGAVRAALRIIVHSAH